MPKYEVEATFFVDAVDEQHAHTRVDHFLDEHLDAQYRSEGWGYEIPEGAVRVAEEQSERFIACFHPQAWVNDNAIECDLQGEHEWDCTKEFYEQFDLGDRELMVHAMDTEGEALDNDDVLKHDPHAPDWVRNWSGPFSIYVRRAA